VRPLTDVEVRVLGCLVEKERTVPDTYPMTLNGLRTACNQSSSRDPVVAYDEGEVTRALDALKDEHLVRFVHAAHGSRTTKYRQVLDEALDLDAPQLALVAVLMLRGPQTGGELRTRTDRLHAFESVDEVESTLASLAARDEPLVRCIGRQPGQRDDRWAHLLSGEPPALAVAGAVAASPGQAFPRGVDPDGDRDPTLIARVAALEAKVADLERLLHDL
jgi:uncharacterized protein YceH (UPF0502 family)